MKPTTVLALTFSILFGAASTTAEAHTSSCDEMVPFGAPTIPAKMDTTKLCRIAYVLVHDNKRLTPVYASELLLAENLSSKNKRVDAFKADPDLDVGRRAELSDYDKEYDRGHIVPFEDARKFSAAALQTFYLSNIVPQNLHMNRGVWNQIESQTRGYAHRAPQGVYVITGPVYSGPIKLKGNVAVPSHLFKVIINKQSQQGIAYIVPNRGPKKGEKWYMFQVPIKAVEDVTGINFTPQYPRALFKYQIGTEFTRN